MTLVGRATVWWLLNTIFLLLIVLRLDSSLEWTWFSVFSPVWLLDMCIIFYLVVSIVDTFPWIEEELQVGKKRAVFLLVAVVLKLTFELMLCAQLDDFMTISYFFLFVPLWLMLSMVTGMVVMDTLRDGQHPHHQ